MNLPRLRTAVLRTGAGARRVIALAVLASTARGDEWLPAIKDSTAATTWGNWRTLTESYVIPLIGTVVLQSLTAPQLQALYNRLRASGRVKTDLSSAIYAAWTKATSDGKEPTAKQIAVATGASVSTAQAALRRFRAGTVPKVKPPGLEAKTVRNIHVMLHSALANAVRWRYVSENVAEHVNPPKVKRRKPTIWTAAQMRKFLQFAAGDRFYALFFLAATTGLRRAELCGLRWSAIDLDAKTLTVLPDTMVVVNGQAGESDGKSDNAPRLMSLDRATVAALTAWRDIQRSERALFESDYLGTDRVFTWENGRDVHPDVIRQRFNRLSERCGLLHIRLYDIRHTYATAALRSGVNPKIVSTRLGHASVGFTLTVYSHALPGMDREAADTIAGMFVDQEPDEDAVSKSVSKRRRKRPPR